MGADGQIDYARRARETLGYSRWWLVLVAAVMMGLVSPYQYVWSSIEGPLAESLGVPLPQLGLVFTLFVVFQAGSQFPVGRWRDEHGPRSITLLAGVLAGGGYVGLAYATEVWQLYFLYSVGAVGVGIVYTVAVNTALKWFPDRRGLTTGVGTMAFAGGSALFVPYVRANATVGGYDAVLQNMGVLIGAGILVGALVLRDPPAGWPRTGVDGDGGESTPEDGSSGERAGTANAPPDEETTDPDPSTDGGWNERQYGWREMVRTWQFWVLYAMFVAVSGAGLMLTAKIISFAGELGLAATVATLSATLLPVAGGIGRLLLGEVSDRVPRTKAMTVAFTLCGIGLLGVVATGRAGFSTGFVVAVVGATFFWSPQYTLFPSLVGDYYGEKHSSANYALVYSGKMWGGVFGGAVAGWVITVSSWTTTFVLGGCLAIAAGIAALVLRPPEDRTPA